MRTSTLATDRIRPALLDGLDPYQRDAVAALTGPLLVVAGPGSGKTRVLTHRLAALVDAGVYPSRLLAVTFTNKAAREMKGRLATLIGDAEADRATVATFHSVCARILRYHHEAAGLPKRFTILDADEALRVVVHVCGKLGHTTGMAGPEAKQVAKAFYSSISAAKNAATTATALMASASPDLRATGEVMAAYDAELHRMGAVDFDDLLLRVLWLLQNHPDTAAALRSRWDFVSVDEFQDTNAVQYEIVMNLVADHHNLCVVGDADQSIYAFRGARPAVVESFSADYPAARVVVLERNYRSTSAICAVSRAIIAPNEAKFRAAQEPMGEAGSPAVLTSYASDLDEASAVVGTILTRGGRLSEHAILVRTNSLTRPLEAELTKRMLSYDVVGTVRFIERAEVRDAAAWLLTAANPSNWIHFERSVTNPKRGAGPTTLAKVRDLAEENGVDLVTAAAAYAAGNRSKVAAALGEYAEQVAEAARRAYTLGPVPALQYILEECGVRAMVAERDRKEGSARVENLDQLLEWAGEFTGADAEAATTDFLEKLSLASSEDEGDDTVEKVQILTMHAAKGKEFDHVYVVGCEDEVLPHARALDEGDDALAEERRLFFVAASRARVTLDISWCARRMRFGKTTDSKASMFLDDLPEGVVSRVDRSGGATWGRRGSTGAWGGAGGARSTGWGGRSAGGSGSGSGFGSGAGRGRSSGPAWTPGASTQSSKSRERVSTVDPALVSAGTRVRHAKFGDGTVESVSGNTAVVVFADAKRNLMLTVAPLSLVD